MGIIATPEVEAAGVDRLAQDTSAQGLAAFKHEVDDYARKVGPEGIKEMNSHMTSDSAKKVLQELELLQNFDSSEINQAASRGDANELRAYTAESSTKYLVSLQLTDQGKGQIMQAKQETNTHPNAMYNMPPHPQDRS